MMRVRKEKRLFAKNHDWTLKMEIEKRTSGKGLGITKFGCSEFELLINASRAFGRSTYHGIYVIDLVSKSMLYVSENMEKWYGASSQEIKRAGMGFYLENIPLEERLVLKEVNQKALYLFNRLPLEGRMDYVLVYDFHVACGNGRRLVRHSLTPMSLEKDGKIRLVLCSVSLSPRKSIGYYMMRRTGTGLCFEYSLGRHHWVKRRRVMLSKMEREVLFLSAQGFTITAIAHCLSRSEDAIKSCRKKIFSKLDVTNITSALAVVRSESL